MTLKTKEIIFFVLLETNAKESSKPKDAKEAMEKAKQLLASGV